MMSSQVSHSLNDQYSFPKPDEQKSKPSESESDSYSSNFFLGSFRYKVKEAWQTDD